MGLFAFLVLVSCVICAILCSHVAGAKGLDAGAWSTAGLFFGPIALLALAAMPDRWIHRYLSAIAEKAGADIRAIESSEERYSFAVPKESTENDKIYTMIKAIAIDNLGLSQKVSTRKSKVLPTRIVANDSEGKCIANACLIRRESEKTYWKIKYTI